MKNIYIATIVCVGSLYAQAQTINCDKLGLNENDLHKKTYRDCKQISHDSLTTADEEIAYAIPSDNLTPKEYQKRLEAIKRLKEKDEYFSTLEDSEIEKLATSVPDYSNWSLKEINKYKAAVKLYNQ